MRDCGSAECPHNKVRCKPTPRPGFSLAQATASVQAGSLTIRLAVVRIPSWCARMTAWLIEWDRPKSSAFTMSRRRQPGAGLASDPITRGHRAESEPVPGARNQQQLLALVQPGWAWTEHVVAPLLQLVQ